MVAVYTGNDADFVDGELSKLRVSKFLNNKSTLLKLLPPTEDAFIQHLRRAALATILDKSAHIPTPPNLDLADFGWTLDSATGKLSPIRSTQPPWPQQMTQTLSCKCTKGCNRNCSCNKRNIPCYIGCHCQGSTSKCSRARFNDTLVSNSDSDSE